MGVVGGVDCGVLRGGAGEGKALFREAGRSRSFPRTSKNAVSDINGEIPTSVDCSSAINMFTSLISEVMKASCAAMKKKVQ